MGFQKGCDTSGMEQNTKAQASAQQRTSTVSKKAQDTTHNQYARLNGSGKSVGTGE